MNILPWWLKIGAKIVLSRFPISYELWQKLGLFRHGQMDKADYARVIFNQHILRSGLEGRLLGKTILELGPGDSVATALFSACYGAKCILIDSGAFASRDVSVYQKLAIDLSKAGFSPPDLSSANSIQDVMKACGAVYLTEGLKSFSDINTGSVDFIFSQAVLEHVRKHEFSETMRQCRRILSASGVASHQVDLRDHLSEGLNNLRFKEEIWESDFFVKSGFYTNRIRFTEMINYFTDSGFTANAFNTIRWNKLPIDREALDIEFSDFADEDLNVQVFDVILRPSNFLSSICKDY